MKKKRLNQSSRGFGCRNFQFSISTRWRFIALAMQLVEQYDWILRRRRGHDAAMLGFAWRLISPNLYLANI
ncbi:hypothetical protein LINPERHAP1_LOCUS25666 [Linum perenne]